MKRRDLLKTLRLAPLLVPLCACTRTRTPPYRVIVAARSLPAGTVIRDADIKISEVWIDHPDVAFGIGGLTDDRTRIVGHNLKVDIPEEQTITVHQID